MEAVKIISSPLALIPGPDRRALLSPAQAEARSHNVTVLKTFGGGKKDKPPSAVLVEVNEAIQFKVGEIIGIDLDKSRRHAVEIVKDGPIARAAAEVTGEEEAADAAAEQAFRLAEKARADAAAKANLQEEARAKWQASAELQKQHPDVATYLASLDLA